MTLRCGNADCTLRARAGARCTDMLGEIDAEDRAPNQLELLQAELEDAEGAAEGSEEAGGGVSAKPGGSEGGIVELWPFAFTVNYCMNLLTDIGEGRKAQAVAILTPSAHPGPWLAARALALAAFVFTRRQHAHALQHGRTLGSTLREAMLAPQDPVPWPRTEDRYQCILGEVVGDQGVVEAYTVGAGTLWRDGMNRAASGEAFHAAACRLVAEQLETFGGSSSGCSGGSSSNSSNHNNNTHTQ